MIKLSKPRTRKGFFFTVLALVLVSFMFISVQLWAQSQQVQEQRQAERFRLEALKSSLALIDNVSLSRFANASLVHAINNLSNALQEYPSPGAALPCSVGPGDTSGTCGGYSLLGVTPNPFPDGTYYVNTSIYELMVNGNTSGHLFNCPGACSFYFSGQNLTYNDTERKYMLSNYFNQTANAAALLGYNISWGAIENFTFNQTDAWTLVLHFEVPVNLSDNAHSVNISKRLGATVQMDINGLIDPMILHDDMNYRTSGALSISLRPHRNVYHVPNYNTSTDANASLLISPDPNIPSTSGGIFATEGLGWFFGPVTTTNASGFNTTYAIYNLSHISTWIYATGDQGQAMSAAQSGFGGVILEGAWNPNDLANSYYQNSSVILNNCNYTIWRQKNPCYYCVLHEIPNDTKACSDIWGVAPDTVPANPDIPYIGVSAGPLPFVSGHDNYHLTDGGSPPVYEVLILSHQNASNLYGNPPQYQNRAQSTVLGKYASINAANSSIWDLTGPRDVAICGFYVKSFWGPSYTQRYIQLPNFFAHEPGQRPYSAALPGQSEGRGIESFVVGRWAGGADDPTPNAGALAGAGEYRSRVDYLFYSGTPGIGGQVCTGSFDMGLPACKDVQMCTDNSGAQSPRSDATGRFALTTPGNAGDPTDRYGLDSLVLPKIFDPGKPTWCD